MTKHLEKYRHGRTREAIDSLDYRYTPDSYSCPICGKLALSKYELDGLKRYRHRNKIKTSRGTVIKTTYCEVMK